jgi:alkyl-hydroperoxide reductase/thiol specific antioxidant family protein
MVATAGPEARVLENALTNEGPNLAELSERSPVLLVFLRHLGCVFCRETLADIASRQEFLKERNIRPVLAHMGQEEDAAGIFRKYGLVDALRVSDPSQDLYRAFGLERGRLWQIFSPVVLWRMLVAGLFRGHGAGMPVGDAFQMPGVFLLHRGKVIMDFRHETIAARPDYSSFTPEEE